MRDPELLYVTYIAAGPQRVWQALTDPELTRQYFLGRSIESDWEPGSKWLLRRKDDIVTDFGEILESEPPRFLRLSWRAEGTNLYCEVIYTLEEINGLVRLSVAEAHLEEATDEFRRGGHEAWPLVLSGLKTLLETQQPLPPFDAASAFRQP